MILGTVGAFGFADFHPPEILSLYAQAGCTVAQAYRNRLKPVAPSEMLAVCSDVGLRIDSLHAHFGDDLDLSSENETARASAMRVYEGEIDVCRQLGGDLLVLHPSPPQTPTTDLARRYDQLRRSMHEFARLGEKTGMRFAFENMPGYHSVGPDVRRLVDEIAAVDSPHVLFLLDIAHAHMTCGVVEAIRIAGRHIRYTHVCDNDGAVDAHLLPFSGNLPWEACCEALHEVGYQGVFLLEVFEQADALRQKFNTDWKRRIQALLRAEP